MQRFRRFRLPPMLYLTEGTVQIPLEGFVGQVSVEVTLDPENRIEEIYEDNNSARRSIYVYSTSISLAKPLSGSVLQEARPRLAVYSPEVPAASARSYFFELDTVPTFDSAFLLSSGAVAEGPIVTEWQPPGGLATGTYYWRCRMFDGARYSKWIRSRFAIAAPGDSVSWKETADDLRRSGLPEGLLFANGALQLNYDPARAVYLEVLSAGFNDGSDCKLVVNYEVINRKGRGHHVAVLDAGTGTLLAGPRRFDTYADSAAANEMADFILQQPENSIFLIGIMDDGSVSMTERAYQALESIGSAYCRSVGFRDSWAIIGRKGAVPGSVPELWVARGGGAAVVRDTLQIYRYGEKNIYSPEIGPATEWRFLRWQVNLPGPETDVALTVLAKNRMTNAWEVVRSVADGNYLNLEWLSARHYPKLKLVMKLSSGDGLHTPEFYGWELAFGFPPDVATNPALISVENDSVLEGKTMRVLVPVFNVGMVASDSFAVRLYAEGEGAQWDSLATRIVPPVPVDDSLHLHIDFTTTGFVGRHKFKVVLDPDERLTEISEANNRYTSYFFVRKDTLRPDIRITFDDREILPGDLVTTAPTIRIEVRDNSPLAIADTGLVRLFLDTRPLYYATHSGDLTFEPLPASEEQGSGARVIFRPVLTSGEHLLEVIARDATQNAIYGRAEFRVIAEFSLQEVLNYPNPFAEETDFTYTLTQPADQVTLSIYTVAGRMIFRDDQLPAGVGFQSYHWDGRDADGDPIANGVYLYRLVARAGNKSVATIGKLIVMK